MKVFQKLTVRGERVKLGAFVKDLEAPTKWLRNLEVERRLQALPDAPGRTFCFMKNGTDEVQASIFFIFQPDKDQCLISNIVPTDKASLALAEYNAILQEFSDDEIRPRVEKFGLGLDISPAEVDLSVFLDPDAKAKLVRFSHMANKSTGSTHPSDREAWMAFLIASHHSRRDLPVDMLRQWLVEDEGWSPDAARELARQYEFSRELLSKC